MTLLKQAAIQHKINLKTKPLGALGKLEGLALQICKIQNSLEPVLSSPTIFVLAGDHGIAKSGVSAYPQEVTWQMVYNFLGNGAAINVFAKQHGISLHIVDTGVNKDFDNHPALIHLKVGFGTKNFLNEEAMTKQELEMCFANGKKIVQDLKKSSDCNVVGFGEMGIGNTSSAALIMHCITKIPLDRCIGKGTGLDDAQLESKKGILLEAIQLHKKRYEFTLDGFTNIRRL